ncbi:MAG: stalk domain-containing protein, partial [Clostridia bacterium]
MNHLKKMLAILISTLLLCGQFAPVFAVDTKIFVSVNGKKLSTLTSGLKTSKGYLVNATRLSAKMGLKYSFVAKTKKITLSKSTKKVVLTLQQITALYGSVKLTCKVAPKLIGTTAYVDPSVVMRVFGYKYIKYSATKKTLEIAQKAPSPTSTPSATPKPTAKPTSTPTAKPTPTITPTPT